MFPDTADAGDEVKNLLLLVPSGGAKKDGDCCLEDLFAS